MKNILLINIIILLAFSCKKVESKYEGLQANNPVYFATGDIETTKLDLQVNDSTVFLSHGIIDFNGFSSYYSEIIDQNTEEKFKIILVPSERPRKNYADYKIKSQSLKFLVHEKACFKFDFGSNLTQENLFSYSLNNQFVNSPEIEIADYGVYTIPIKFKGHNQLYSATINHGFVNQTLFADFDVFNNQNNAFFKAHNEDYKHEWYIDEQLVGQEKIGTINTSIGTHEIVHIVKDDNGNQAEHRKLFTIIGNHIDWVLNPVYCDNSHVQEPNFEKIVIQYTKNGEVYTSEYNTENLDKSLTIHDIDYFLEGAFLSVKFSIDFNCRLANKEQSKFIDLENFNGTFKYKLQ